MSGYKRKYTSAVKKQQMRVLQEIYASKEILFGKFSSSTPKQEISKAWDKVAAIASKYGIVPLSNGYKFRRVTWQNWRRAALSKVDRMKKTGVGDAAKKDIIDENDKLILSILGEKKAEGIDEFESDDFYASQVTKQEVEESEVNEDPLSSQLFSSGEKQSRRTSQKLSATQQNDEMHELRKLYLTLCCYAKRLECRESEIRLNLGVSKLTEPLYALEDSD